MGGSSSQTIGYRYFMGLHMAICHGPVTSVNKLYVGKRNPDDGGAGISPPATVNTTFNIAHSHLFGGDEKEGGVVGTLDIEMGADTQTQNAYLVSELGSLVSAYRGVTCAVWRAPTLAYGSNYTSNSSGGYLAAISPYPKPWAFEVTDIPGGSFNPTKQDINSGSCNGGHIIRDCLTNVDWGLGHSVGTLDDTSFTATTDTLFDESFGLSLIYAQQSSMEEFINEVLTHINGVLYTHRQTGLFTLKLVRDDYDAGTLPIFDESNISSMLSFERPAFAEMVNEVTIAYRVRGELEDTSITAQELASVQAQGAVVSQKMSFPGIDSNALAAIVAQRELKQLSTPLARVRFVANREAWDVNPGDVIKVSWGAYGIEQVILRVIGMDYGSLENGLIGIDAVEDVFGLPLNSYLTPSDTIWVDEVAAPVASPTTPVFEMPFFTSQTTFSDELLATVTDSFCYLQMVAENPTVAAFNAKLITRTGADDFEDVANGQFCPTVQLTGALDKTTKLTIAINNFKGAAGEIVIGGYAYLNDEVLRVDSVDIDSGLMDVGRGYLDSIPQSHIANDIIYFADSNNLHDPTIYAGSDSVDAKILPQTGIGLLAEGDAATLNLTMVERRSKPYNASQIQISGAYFPATLTDAISITVTWAHQDRTQQLTPLSGQDWYEVSLGAPETGVLYEIRYYDDAGATLLFTDSNNSGTFSSFTPATAVGVPIDIRIEVDAIRDGTVTSLNTFSHIVEFTKPLGVRSLMSGDIRVLESTDRRVLES